MSGFEKMFSGSIPEGEYHAVESPEQAAAMNFSRRIARKLVDQHPEVAKLYEEGLSYTEIAERVIPDIMRNFPEIAPKAVGCAVRALHDKTKQELLTKEHRRNTLNTIVGDRMSPENREVWRRAQTIRTVLHGAPTEAMIRGRGQTPWSAEEKEALHQMLLNPHFQHEDGRPHYALIAPALNDGFHGGEEVRKAKSLGNYVRNQRRVAKKK